MIQEGPHPASFRDPSGFLFTRAGILYRQVNRSYEPHYQALMNSGLYAELERDGLLIAHEETGLDCPDRDAGVRVIKPQPVPFISYPHEWCPAQLRDAALLTLRISRLALERGMLLKDAPAVNIQFLGCRPILIDTLSFEPYREGEPWAAYRQFCENFLAPLALACGADARLLELFLIHPGGIPLDLASGLLPAASWLKPSLMTHIHWHSRLQARHSGALPPGLKTRSFGRRAMLGLWDHLESSIEALRWAPKKSFWSRYRAETPYDQAAARSKGELLRRLLAEIKPRVVWDLGANDGLYARAALENGAHVVALEKDADVVETGYKDAASRREAALNFLVSDITRPSPALGWHCGERSSLMERGPADALLALALVHHLVLGSGIPLPRVASFFAALGRDLIVEYVPPEDPQARRLLERPGGVPLEYNESSFLSAFSRHFHLKAREPIANCGRTLFLFRDSNALPQQND